MISNAVFLKFPATRLRQRLAFPVILVLSLILAACSSNEDEFLNTTEQELYEAGVEALELNSWVQAIAIFQQLEAAFPFGQYAEQSQIELVYAYYMNREPEAARAAADRFIRLYPDSHNLDYAYYLKGMSYYTEDQRLLGRWLPTDPSKRDPGKARESFSDFSQLITRFPNSPYAPDARARMIYLRNLLADYEIHVAEFYIRRQAFLSALNRARYVVENFQGAPAIPRALAIQVETYLRLGLEDLADTSLAILRDNYPDSPSFDRNGNFVVTDMVTDPSLLYTVTFGLLGSNKRNASLAPRPPPESATTGSASAIQEDIDAEVEAAEEAEEEKKNRLWVRLLTLGFFG